MVSRTAALYETLFERRRGGEKPAGVGEESIRREKAA
jgi:hypothetical protein